jgi:hypothetical protein
MKRKKIDEIKHIFAALGVYIEISSWPPPFTMIGCCSLEDNFELRMTQM